MSRAQVKIAGIGGDAEGQLYKPEMLLIHRTFGFGTMVRNRTSLPGKNLGYASTAPLQLEQRPDD
jgi:hypothetical protein